MRQSIAIATGAFFAAVVFYGSPTAEAARLTVHLTNAGDVIAVGAFLRWDRDGNHRKLVNKDAKIDAPEVEATATKVKDGTWEFNDLAPGKYDLVLMLKGKVRVEGFCYPPVLDFDPFLPSTATVEEEFQTVVGDEVRTAKHYENKVDWLYMGGDKKTGIRVLVQLIRDKPTSYTPGAGTMRHEIWQFDWNYGGWQKNKRTKVLDRVILQVSQLRQWTWIWEPKLGGIEVQKEPVTIEYSIPAVFDPIKVKGLYPY